MALPISQLLREIEKAGAPKPKPKLATDTPEELIQQEAKDLSMKSKETGFERQKTQTKIEEHTPSIYETVPETEEAQKFLKLNQLKRDLYLKSVRLKKEQEHVQGIAEYRNQGKSAREYIKDIISKEMGVGKKFSNIEVRTQTITNKLYSMMNDVRVELRTTWGGLKQNRELGYELVRYLKDGTVKNEQNMQKVTKMADQWKKTSEAVRNLRNKAGGQVGKLEDWVMPQSHDKVRMIKAGKDSWKQQIKTKLDVDRIQKEQGADIDKILDSAWNNITKRNIETAPKGVSKPVAKKGEFERILHFKDGDSIIDYNMNFGNEDVLSVFDNHIRSQANEIAQMQILGSNPEKTYEYLKEFARNEGMGKITEKSLDRIWNVSSGKVDAEDIVSKADATLASVSGAYRSIQVGSKLGGATLSSVADVGNIAMTHGYRNLNSIQIFGRGIATLVEEALNTGVASRTQLAARIGVVSEFANASITNSRFSEAGSGWAQRRAENVLRLSGLTAWTNALRTGFGLELAANIAENIGKNYNDLPFKKLFEEYGITPDDWAKVQQSKLEDIKGAKFININDMEESVSYKIGEMINAEMDATIITPGYRTRALTTWGAAKGTVKGEAARGFTLFKSFPITVMMMHFNRMGQLSNGGRLAYGAGVLATGMVFGSISLWLKDIAKGETPRDPLRLQMIPEAIVQSGGVGIIGDMFLDENVRRYGTTWWTLAGGVPASTIKDIGDTSGDIIDTIFSDQEASKTAANIYNRATNYIPGQNMWQTRLLFKETFAEYIGELVDPDRKKKERRYKKAIRTRGQELIFD